ARVRTAKHRASCAGAVNSPRSRNPRRGLGAPPCRTKVRINKPGSRNPGRPARLERGLEREQDAHPGPVRAEVREALMRLSPPFVASCWPLRAGFDARKIENLKQARPDRAPPTCAYCTAVS